MVDTPPSSLRYLSPPPRYYPLGPSSPLDISQGGVPTQTEVGTSVVLKKTLITWQWITLMEVILASYMERGLEELLWMKTMRMTTCPLSSMSLPLAYLLDKDIYDFSNSTSSFSTL